MTPNFPLAKAINSATYKATATEAGCVGNLDLVPDVDPPSLHAQVNPKSSLPSWVVKGAAESAKGVPSFDGELSDGSEDFMTVIEAASALRLSERTVRRHLAERKSHTFVVESRSGSLEPVYSRDGKRTSLYQEIKL